MLLTDLVNSLANKLSAENPAEGQLTTRLFDYWRELRGNCAFPSRELIRFEDVPELSEYGFTVSVGEDGSDPTFHFVGSAIREHIGRDLGDKIPLGNSDSTLLSLSLRLTPRRYVEVLQRKAPVSFESEVVDHGGTNFLFRIIMLPFSEDNRKIDFILGAITYKEKLSPSPAPTDVNPDMVAQLEKAARYAEEAQNDVEAQSEPEKQNQTLIVGPGVRLTGEITNCDTLVVEGHVEGSAKASVVEIAISGTLIADIEIKTADISGRFSGSLNASERLVIRPTGRASGQIRYKSIEIEAGGRISGDVQDEEEAKGASLNTENPNKAYRKTS